MEPHNTAYTIKLTFGPNQGKSLGELYQYKREYLEWMAGATKIPIPWRVAAAKTLLGEPVNVAFPERPKVEIPKEGEIKIFPVNSKRFGVQFPFSEGNVNQFKYTIDGASWDEEGVYWTFPIPQVMRVIDWFGGPSKVAVDAKVRDAYRAERSHLERLKEISARTTSDLTVATKIALRGDQLVALEFADAVGGSFLDADDTGNGKTATSIGWAIHRGGKTLVVVPNGLQSQWEAEIRAFAGAKACIWLADGPQGDKRVKFHIVHYDVVDRWVKEFNKLKFANLICDEAVKITNYKAIRTKAIMGVTKDSPEKTIYPGIKVQNKMLLTASPIKNKPRELFTLLNFLDSSRFTSPWHYINRYEFETQPGQYQHLDELYERASSLMIRRPKSILNGHKEQVIDLIVDLTPDERKKYVDFMVKLVKKWGKTNPTAASAHEVRRVLFDLKWDRTTALIDELVESDRSVLVFAIQKEHVERIAKHYGSMAAFVHGDVKRAERDSIKEKLIDRQLKIGVYTLETGAMGTDGLQRTISDTIFPERSFLPMDHYQAHGRTNRPGQKLRPQMYYLTAKGTYEEYQKDRLIAKMEMIAQSVDGKSATESKKVHQATESMFSEIAKLIAKEFKHPILEPVDD
jgi:superfamily II DNA or RNA helicase